MVPRTLWRSGIWAKQIFLTFVYLSKCNTKLPYIFGNSKKNVFVNRSSVHPPTVDQFIKKTFVWIFQKCRAVLCYILINKQMFKKVFCSNVHHRIESGAITMFRGGYIFGNIMDLNEWMNMCISLVSHFLIATHDFPCGDRDRDIRVI